MMTQTKMHTSTAYKDYFILVFTFGVMVSLIYLSLLVPVSSFEVDLVKPLGGHLPADIFRTIISSSIPLVVLARHTRHQKSMIMLELKRGRVFHGVVTFLVGYLIMEVSIAFFHSGLLTITLATQFTFASFLTIVLDVALNVIIEEFYFRAYLFSVISPFGSSRKKEVIAAICSIVVFVGLHLPGEWLNHPDGFWGKALFLSVGSVFIVLIYKRTRNIFIVVAIHFLFNMAAYFHAPIWVQATVAKTLFWSSLVFIIGSFLLRKRSGKS